jgi:hypothetical protein
VQIRALKREARPYKAHDSDGLLLLVQPTVALLWRFRYKVFGIELKLSRGTFPDVALQRARRLRDAAWADVVEGGDAAAEKRQKSHESELAAKTTFELVATEYIQRWSARVAHPPPSRRRAGFSSCSTALLSVR